MKIKTKKKPYSEVASIKRPPHEKPKRAWSILHLLLRVLSIPDLMATKFVCREHGMEKLSKKEPALFLMNHSAFIDLKIASKLLFGRKYHIVCTSDGFVGKNLLMRLLGCIPTQKFVTDITLVRDLMHTTGTLKSSVLMYPEASYSFDGTATPIPASLGMLCKRLSVPVIMIRTHGAFLRDPLYNGLRLRKAKVSADMTYILSPEELKEKSIDEINEILVSHFTFDNFKEQQEQHITVTEKFRAEGLNRVLYKCPHCGTESKMQASGITVSCEACGKAWELTEYGELRCRKEGTPTSADSTFEPKEFSHIPDWYAWERDCVRKEIEAGTYRLDIPVDIRMLVDTRAIYEVGEGRLVHTAEGFHLTGCDGALDYSQKPLSSYSLYADYFWYEIGDMVCIGDTDALYYCFPKTKTDIAAKTRLAAEELYKMAKESKVK